MPKLAVSGTGIHYEDSGSGPPIVFIPGALGTGAGDFAEQLPVFSRAWRVIAPDLRGYGQSRPPEREYPVDFYQSDANDVIGLMSELGCERFAVLGWSDGANVATLLAATFPDRISKLVVWAGNSFVSDEEVATFQGIRSISTWSPRAVDALKPVYGDQLGRIWGDYVDGLARIHAAGGDLYRTKLSQVRCPALILHGAKDPLVPGFHPEILHKGIMGSELFVFPEGKHNVHARYAPEFNQVVSGFLSRQPA
jgi:valacyclovir hydrolase